MIAATRTMPSLFASLSVSLMLALLLVVPGHAQVLTVPDDETLRFVVPPPAPPARQHHDYGHMAYYRHIW